MCANIGFCFKFITLFAFGIHGTQKNQEIGKLSTNFVRLNIIPDRYFRQIIPKFGPVPINDMQLHPENGQIWFWVKKMHNVLKPM